MNKEKKIPGFLFSMKTAIVLLLLLILACVAGSLISQGQPASYYRELWPGLPGEVVLALKLDDVFHSVWFAALTGLLCLNLLGCNLIHLPALRRNWKRLRGEEALAEWDHTGRWLLPEDPEPLFRALHFSRTESLEGPEGEEERYAVKGKAGIFGPWLTHLGLLVIIAGFSLGQIFTQTTSVYGVPGQTKPIGDTGYSLSIDSFDIALREDDTVDQYTAGLTVTEDGTGRSISGKASVNHPLSLFGMKFYQNSTGFAATVSVYNGGILRQQEVLCAGETLEVLDEEGLVVYFRSFYPDYVITEEGVPGTASSRMNNPAYLYVLYYHDQILGMNLLKEGQEITVDQYRITFTDPQHYTLIQVKRDPFTYLALAGGLILMAALFLSFYVQTKELLAVKRLEGDWLIQGRSRKGGVLFADEVNACVLSLGGKEAK